MILLNDVPVGVARIATLNFGNKIYLKTNVFARAKNWWQRLRPLHWTFPYFRNSSGKTFKLIPQSGPKTKYTIKVNNKIEMMFIQIPVLNISGMVK